MTAPVNELEDEIAHLRDLDLHGLRANLIKIVRLQTREGSTTPCSNQRRC
jgi:hypothetical protein